MRLSKRRAATRVRMNMTPMIDIVFLLIIFFMTVTQVSRINRERMIELPKQSGSEEQKPTVLTINVDNNGQIVVAGALYELPDLIALVADELARQEDDPSRLAVVLRADRRGTSRTVNQIMNSLTRLQIHRVRIAVQVPR